MDIYFKLKVLSDFILPVILIISVTLIIVGTMLYEVMTDSLKQKLMEKLGYEYRYNLGFNVGIQFQPHWEKGKFKIHHSIIKRLKYRKIKQYVQTMEEVIGEARKSDERLRNSEGTPRTS